MTISLNGFRVSFSSPTFKIRVLSVPLSRDMETLRSTHGNEWFLHWREGKAYAIPLTNSPSVVIGEEQELDCANHDNLHILAARLNDILPTVFSQYQAFRDRPFAILGKKNEIVSTLTKNWSNLHPLVTFFQIRPKFEFNPRLVEIRNGETFVALFLNVQMYWSVQAPLNELIEAGVDLSGLYVVRRELSSGQRRLVGKIKSVTAKEVFLSESYDELESIDVTQVYLEASKLSFSRCLRTLLGSRFQEFEKKRELKEGDFLLGPSLDQQLNTMKEVLDKHTSIPLSTDLSCAIGHRVEINNTAAYKSLLISAPVEYCFDAARSKRDTISWKGLLQYGPYSKDTLSTRTPRLLIVTPDSAEGKVGQFIRILRDGIQSISDSRYPKGFASTFGFVNPDFVTCVIPLLNGNNKSPAELYRNTVENFIASDTRHFDAAIVAILDEQAKLPDPINPYLNAKATLLMNGIPVQEARLSTLTAPHEALQWSIQNL